MVNDGTELRINRIRHSDLSDYTCVARNGEGRIHHTVKVVIAGGILRFFVFVFAFVFACVFVFVNAFVFVFVFINAFVFAFVFARVFVFALDRDGSITPSRLSSQVSFF